jgi:hypothetical protein
MRARADGQSTKATAPAMTTLPATLLEAEAIDFARKHIAFVRSGKLKLFGVASGAWFEMGESQRACRLMLRELMLRDVTILIDAVTFARAGYEMFEECLRELILEFQNRGEEMPVYLAAFAMELTRGIQYSRKAGRHRSDNTVRDIIIGMIVGRVAIQFNLRPKRNFASRRRASASSIVAAALELEGMAMSEANVRRMWETMPTGYKNNWDQYLSGLGDA